MSEIDVRIGVDVNSKALKQFKKDLRGLSGAADIAKLKLAGVSYAIYRLGKESVIAAVKAQKLDTTFATSLRNLNMGERSNELLAYIDKVSLATGVLDQELIPAFSRLISSTKNVAASQSLLNTAVDTAQGTGKDLATVTTILVKAMEGQRKGLSSLGLGIDAATLKTMDLTDIVAALNAAYGGTAAANAATFAGMVDRMRRSVELAKETLGQSFLTQLDLSSKEMHDLGTAVGIVAKGFGWLAGSVGSFVATTVSGLKNVKDYFMSDPIMRWILERFGVRTGTPATGASTIGDYMMGRTKTPEQKANEELLKVLAAIEAANKKRLAAELARQRAAEAAKKRQAQLDKELAQKQMLYDVDRIGLMKALGDTQTADTKKRLTDLLLINTATYAQNLGLTTTEQMLDLINKQMTKWYGTQTSIKTSIDDTVTALKTVGTLGTLPFGPQVPATFGAGSYEMLPNYGAAADALTNATQPGAWDAYFAQLANGATTPTTPTVTVNVSGSLVAQQDLEAAIAGAVNNAARAGLSYNQVFSRL